MTRFDNLLFFDVYAGDDVDNDDKNDDVDNDDKNNDVDNDNKNDDVDNVEVRFGKVFWALGFHIYLS